MQAVVLENPAPIESHPLHVCNVPVPQVGPGEILLKVSACGVCRSNLHMIEGDWLANGVPAKLPIIPGHEVVGTVAALGEGVASLAIGERVGVQPLWSTCGHCEYCLTGREQLCQRKHITGETVDGGYAEYLVARVEHAYRVPDALTDAEAAPLFCPGITAYGAILKARLAPARSVAIFGIGGVGHMVVEFASLTGAEVVAVDRSPRRLTLARELGASRTVDASSADPGDVLSASGGVDAAIIFAPSSAMVQQAIRATKPGGTVVVGVHADIGALAFADEKTVVGSLLGSRRQVEEVLRLAAEGKVRPVSEAHPLDQAGEVLQRLKRGEIRARAVLVP